MDDDPGGGGPSRPFGSRYESLTTLDEIPLNKQTRSSLKPQTKKRQAFRDGKNEIQYTKHLKMDGRNNGPRYLILTRRDIGMTMKNVSPFLIKKAMDSITPNVTISRLNDGTLLLKSVDRQQAEKLLKQDMLTSEIKIQIAEHPTMNTTKGTISCYDLKFLTDEEILEGLRDSQVVDIKRIKRKNHQGQLEDTSVFVLTFNLSYLPDAIDVGFHLCKIRQYVPTPIRCMSCLKFGHKKDQCRGNRICADCAELFHDNTECKQKYRCVNCRGVHSALNRECPVYQDEFEIQRIRVTDRITMKEARRKRRSQAPTVFFPSLNRSFSEVVSSQNEMQTNQQHTNTPTAPREQGIETIGVMRKENETTTIQSPVHSDYHITQITNTLTGKQNLHEKIAYNEQKEDNDKEITNTNTLIYNINNNSSDEFNSIAPTSSLNTVYQAVRDSIFLNNPC